MAFGGDEQPLGKIGSLTGDEGALGEMGGLLERWAVSGADGWPLIS